MSFDIQPSLAERIRSEAHERGETQACLIGTIIMEYFKTMECENSTQDAANRRKFPRINFRVPAMIEIRMPSNETHCKCVDILNISEDGIAIRMDSCSSRLLDYLNRKQPFVIIFHAPKIAGIIRTLCKPVHITRDAVSVIGSTFVQAPAQLKNYLQAQLAP